MTLPLSELLLRAQPDTVIATGDAGDPVSLAQWRARVAPLAASLRTHPGQRFLLVHRDTLDFATGLFALLHAGKDIVLPPNSQPGTLADMQAHADALLGEGECALPCLPIRNDTDPGVPLQPFDAQLRTLTVMTSGSTGEPKPITKPIQCFEAEVTALEAQWGERIGQACILSTVSHQHIYGLLFRLLWPLSAGRPWLSRTFGFPEPLYAALQQHPRVVLVSSPSQLKRFPPALDLAAVRSRVCCVFSSGGPLPRDAALDWESRLGQSPIEVLGSSETGGVAWRQQNATEADTPWQPFPVVQLHLIHGCLGVTSPFTGQQAPWVMGDRAELLADGRFRLLGRADTIVKVEEKRVSLTAMERALASSSLVDQARIVPLPDNAHRLGAVVVLSAQGKTQLAGSTRRALGEALRDHLLAHFERVLLPRKWRFVDALPVNSLGKTIASEVQACFSRKDFMRIIDEQADQRTIEISLRDEHFEGHFPGLPILAGVRQFDWAVQACSPWYTPDRFIGIRKLKFSHPITPGKAITLHLQQQAGARVQFHYYCDTQLMSSGMIVFKA